MLSAYAGLEVQRRFRLTRAADFQRVRQEGKSYAHPLLVLIFYHRPESGIRVGIAAGKKLGKAVRRNRAKRLLRAAMQTFLPFIAQSGDMILIARPPILQASFAEIRQALESLLRRAGLLNALSNEHHE
ncbi:MAG: ribonuclease P protein component [Anaerolineales bacterium]